MAFEIMYNGKALTKEEFELVKDLIVDRMNNKLSKCAFEKELSRRLENVGTPVVSIQ